MPGAIDVEHQFAIASSWCRGLAISIFERAACVMLRAKIIVDSVAIETGAGWTAETTVPEGTTRSRQRATPWFQGRSKASIMYIALSVAARTPEYEQLTKPRTCG